MALLLTAVAVTGCGQEKDPRMQPTITKQEAIDRVETLIEQAVAQLPDAARLESSRKEDAFPCDDHADGVPEGRAFVERDYWIRNLPKPYEPYFDTLEEYWTDRGYPQIRFDKRGLWWTMVHDPKDGFLISLKTTGDGEQLYIRSQSPCVWPNGTPEPEAD
ncbi:MAG: hypothetical protein ACRDTU_13840 [Micromonosporaceae bacterium]